MGECHCHYRAKLGQGQAFPAVADLCIVMRRLMSFASLVSCFNFVVDRRAIENISTASFSFFSGDSGSLDS